jgi:hypothetical protein
VRFVGRVPVRVVLDPLDRPAGDLGEGSLADLLRGLTRQQLFA